MLQLITIVIQKSLAYKFDVVENANVTVALARGGSLRVVCFTFPCPGGLTTPLPGSVTFAIRFQHSLASVSLAQYH
jgi:hypothetical protein